MWLPLQQDLRRWSVGEGGWGCEQGWRCGVGAVHLGEVRGWGEEREVERVRRWRRLPGFLVLARKGTGKAPILRKRYCRGLEIGGLFHEARHVGGNVGRDVAGGPDVGGRVGRAVGRGPGHGHGGCQGRVSREDF